MIYMEKTNRPYWEQVYSMLETVDVTTGERTVHKRFDSLIEAPNWLPDGNTLLYNAGGSLWLFDLATGVGISALVTIASLFLSIAWLYIYSWLVFIHKLK